MRKKREGQKRRRGGQSKRHKRCSVFSGKGARHEGRRAGGVTVWFEEWRFNLAPGQLRQKRSEHVTEEDVCVQAVSTLFMYFFNTGGEKAGVFLLMRSSDSRG